MKSTPVSIKIVAKQNGNLLSAACKFYRGTLGQFTRRLLGSKADLMATEKKVRLVPEADITFAYAYQHRSRRKCLKLGTSLSLDQLQIQNNT